MKFKLNKIISALTLTKKREVMLLTKTYSSVLIFYCTRFIFRGALVGLA